MFYLYSMTLFLLIGLLIGRLKPQWPVLWIILMPILGCIILLSVESLLYPLPGTKTEVSFRELVPIFFIPPNLLATIVGYMAVKRWFLSKVKE
jgi:hypothetical protein